MRWWRVGLGIGGLAAVVAVLVLALTVTLPDSDPPPPAGPPAIPAVVRQAYLSAAAAIAADVPSCAGLTWTVLAGIGTVESRHAAGHAVSAAGDVTPPILGPRLDGSGAGGNSTPYLDTDGGRLDGDPTYDRAVGPMQFLPETWSQWGRDGNSDGRRDPQNVFDAALTAAAYLCGTQPVDLTDPATLRAAIGRYNLSTSYIDDVLRYADQYAAAAASSGGSAVRTPAG